MKCSKPPFSAASAFQVTWNTFLLIGLPARSLTATESLVTMATSPSFKIYVSRVRLIIAGISDAMKFSPLPRPITNGLSCLVQIIRLGSSAHIITKE